MNNDNKLILLNKIYQLYDDFTGSIDVACKKFCAVCCTRNVTITTLESYKILNNLSAPRKKMLRLKLVNGYAEKRFMPLTTTNWLAVLCAQDKDIPEENIDSAWGACPLLTNQACPIYDARPFGCRSFISKHSCADRGYAEIDPFVLSVNTIFLQFIEHIDQNGYSGNLMDVLLFAKNHTGDRPDNNNSTEPGKGLIRNHPINVLMAPPEHRSKIMSLISELRKISIQAEQEESI